MPKLSLKHSDDLIAEGSGISPVDPEEYPTANSQITAYQRTWTSLSNEERKRLKSNLKLDPPDSWAIRNKADAPDPSAPEDPINYSAQAGEDWHDASRPAGTDALECSRTGAAPLTDNDLVRIGSAYFNHRPTKPTALSTPSGETRLTVLVSFVSLLTVGFLLFAPWKEVIDVPYHLHAQIPLGY